MAKEIGPIAKPKDIRFGDNLPKTRSGKIMRRLLRSLAKGEAITQDTSRRWRIRRSWSSWGRPTDFEQQLKPSRAKARVGYLMLSTQIASCLASAGLTSGWPASAPGPRRRRRPS